jgi:hypothetical protein
MRHAGPRPGHHCVRAGMAALLFAALSVVALGNPATAHAYPTTSITGVPDGWSTSDVTFAFEIDYSAVDSPVDTFYWLGYPSGTQVSYSGPVTVSAEGTSVVRFWSKDSHTDHEAYQFANIRIDKSAPVSAIHGIGDDPDAPRTVPFTITATDPYSGAVATYYRVDGGPPVLYAGEVSLPVTVSTSIDYWSVDAAGNAEAPKSVVVWVDDGLPRTTISGVPASWASAPVTFALAGSSPTGPVTTYYRLGGGGSSVYASPVTVSSEGVTTVTFYSVDAEASREPSRTAQIMIDLTPPASGVSGMPVGWGRTTAHLTFSAGDALSGVAGIRYRVGGAWVTRTSPVAVDVLAQGTTPIEWYAFDVAGNTEAVHAGSISLDFGAPVTSALYTPSSTSTGPVTVSLAATDAVSGVATTEYSVDFGSPQPYVGPVTITKGGTTVFAFRSVDAAGNAEMWTYQSLQISPPADPAPITSVVLSPAVPDGLDGWYRTAPALTVYRDIAGTTYFKAVTDLVYSTSSLSAFSPPLAQGELFYTYYGVSALGVTESPSHALHVKLDNAAPATVSDAVATYASAAAIHLTASDGFAGSGAAHTFYRLDASAQAEGTTIVTAAAGSHTLEFWSVDAAGNAGTHQVATFAVTPAPDLTPPHTTSDAAPVYSGSATVHLQASDEVGGSGVAHTFYRLDAGAQAEGTTVSTGALGSHAIEYWSVDAAGNVEAPRHTATFVVAAVTHTVTPSAGIGGAISPTTAQTVAHGSASPTFTITPSPGYRIADVLVDGTSVGASAAYRFADVSADRTIEAVFARSVYTITASAGAGGSISPATAQTVAHGDDSPTFAIAPSPGYRVAGVLVDGAAVGAVASYRFRNVTSDHTIAVLFAPDDPATSVFTIATSRSSVPVGGTFVLSGFASPSPAMVGAIVHVDVKKPGRAYWSYSSARVVYSTAGRAAWWYRYYVKPGMTRGVYRFHVAYDGGAFATSVSPDVRVSVR